MDKTIAQPDYGVAILQWELRDLLAKEPAGALQPAYVVPANGPFSLEVTFEGQGFVWTNIIEGPGTNKYEAFFYAEGQGAAAPDTDFNPVAPVIGTLTAGHGPYTAVLNVPGGLATPGLYMISCIVKMQGMSGVAGRYAGLLLEIE